MILHFFTHPSKNKSRKKPIGLLLLITVFSFFIISCTETVEEEKWVTVKLNMNYGSNDRAKKTNQNLTEGVSSELLGVLPSNIGFENNYANVREAYDWALTDLEENTVELSLPIDTLISLHAYRFRELHSESELFSSSKNPISFGVSEPFSITETTRSLSIKLNIFPNGAPGIVGQLVSGNTSDTGETAEIQVFLGTPPKKTVTFPISSTFKNLSNISADNLTFSPSDWYIPKTFKITGSTERLISGNKIYQLDFGPAKSIDQDYEGLKSSLDLTHLDKTPRNSTIFLHCKNPRHCPWLLSRQKAYAFPGSQPMKYYLHGHGTMRIRPCFQKSGSEHRWCYRKKQKSLK